MFRELCDFVGIDINRVQFSWVSAAEGARWAELVNTTVSQIRAMGPYTEYKKVAEYPVKEVTNG